MLAPILVLVAIFSRKRAAREARGEKKPVDDLLLRSPGESLRRKLEELDEDINTYLTVSITLGAIVGVMIGQNYQQHRSDFLVSFLSGTVLFLIIEAYLLLKLYRWQSQRRDYRLGLSGELAVGEELNQLMLSGCRVYHDFPSGLDWNIDHIIVAPGGVFAVETKTFSRRKSPRKNQKDHEVIYTGETLEFPAWTTKEPIEQARRNARQLAAFLKSSTAEEVPVYPLTIPIGWFVIMKVKSPCEVLNIKMVKRFITERPTKLSPEQITRICHQLEQKCRDVGF